MNTAKPLLSSHPREAQKVAAYGRWVFIKGGSYLRFDCMALDALTIALAAGCPVCCLHSIC